MLLHQLGHNLAQRCRAQIFALLDDVVMGRNSRYGRRVCGRAAYALFLHRADKRGLGIAGGRLRKLLIRQHLHELQLLPLAQARQRIVDLGALLVACLLVHCGISGEAQLGIICAEDITRALRIDGDVVIYGVCHLAGGKSAPYEAVEPVLLEREILFQRLRREIYVGGANGLMRILRAGLGFKMPRLIRAVILAVFSLYKAACCSESLVGKTQRVGSHVGDKADAALVRNFHALIELLGDCHCALRRHAEAARGLLLQRGCDKRGCGGFLLFAALDGFHRKG